MDDANRWALGALAMTKLVRNPSHWGASLGCPPCIDAAPLFDVLMSNFLSFRRETEEDRISERSPVAQGLLAAGCIYADWCSRRITWFLLA
jgi:hypothetical protein